MKWLVAMEFSAVVRDALRRRGHDAWSCDFRPCQYADFGPADGDVRDSMNKRFMQVTGKNLPEGWNFAQDGETTLDQ